MTSLPTGRLRWAPWPDGGAFKVRLLGAPGKDGTVEVEWLEGPLSGKPARLRKETLRANRRDAAEYFSWEELE